jgi:hypothetical protein
VAQNYALTTKTLVGCDRITARIKKMLFLKARLWPFRAKMSSRGFAKCSGVVRSTKKCGPMLEAGTYIRVGASTEYWYRSKERDVCF